jgi:hypothetical protein
MGTFLFGNKGLRSPSRLRERFEQHFATTTNGAGNINIDGCTPRLTERMANESRLMVEEFVPGENEPSYKARWDLGATDGNRAPSYNSHALPSLY